MLRVLTAQSADEPAPLAPSDDVRFHPATLPREGLAPEEPPTLPIRPASPFAPFPALAREASERGDPFRVGPHKLPKPGFEPLLERALERREVAVLDEVLEFPQARDGERHSTGPEAPGVAQQRAHRLAPVLDPPLRPVAFEQRLLLGGEAHPEESAGPTARRIWHLLNENLTTI